MIAFALTATPGEVWVCAVLAVIAALLFFMAGYCLGSDGSGDGRGKKERFDDDGH